MPQDVYENFSPELQLLYRHLAEGEMDVLQPGKQYAAARAQSLRHSEQSGDNSHVVASAMSVEEWERRRAERIKEGSTATHRMDCPAVYPA